MKKKAIFLAIIQVIAAGIIGMAGASKFMAHPSVVFVFSELGLEPTGRIIIGIIEVSCAILLLTRTYAAIGAFFLLGTMAGAFIAHVSVLGFSIQGDGGRTVVLLAVEIVCASTILYLRRRQLPIVGHLFD